MARSKTWRAVIVTMAFTILFAAMPAVAHAAEPPQREPPVPAPDGARVTVWFPSQIKNSHSGLCLAVRTDNPDTQAVQAPCGDWADQLWAYKGPYVANGKEYWMIINMNSKQCLVARGFTPETPVVQTPCNEAYADQFWFHSRQAVDGRYGQIKSYNTLDKLCVVTRTKNPEARAVLANCTPQFADSLWTQVSRDPKTP
jgi:hypothetical protein